MAERPRNFDLTMRLGGPSGYAERSARERAVDAERNRLMAACAHAHVNETMCVDCGMLKDFLPKEAKG